MPRNKRNGYKRPGYMACGRMVMGDAAKALVIARKVKSLINVEIKNFDVGQTSVDLSITPLIQQLSNIPQGDTTNTRDGSQCKALFLELNYMILFAGSTDAVARCLVVLDKQTNQAIYGIADLLADSTGTDNIISPFNLDNKHRFRVLYDSQHYLSLSKPAVFVERKINLNVLLRYDASTPSIADLTQNSISFIQMTNQSGTFPVITSRHRLRFVDN